MSLAKSYPTVPVSEYLEMERMSEIRHEYLDGQVYMMAGESPRHSNICFNLYTAIGIRLRGKTCRGFSPNMKIATNNKGLYAYPDLAVVCGEPKYHDKKGDILLNPTIIFEVLSPSTQYYDRGEKFLRYTNFIKSLTDYVLISQDKPLVEHFSKQPDNSWKSVVIQGLDAVLSFPTIEIEIPLGELYEQISF
ncbi:MAG: Uma2 family endonuclease [Acidobacteriota bacterium]|mgnify:FL=1